MSTSYMHNGSLKKKKELCGGGQVGMGKTGAYAEEGKGDIHFLK